MLSTDIISNHLNIEELTVPSVLTSISNTCMGILCAILDDIMELSDRDLCYLQILIEDEGSFIGLVDKPFKTVVRNILIDDNKHADYSLTTFSKNHQYYDTQGRISALVALHNIIDKHILHQDQSEESDLRYHGLEEDRAINALSLFAKGSYFKDIQSMFQKYGDIIEEALIEGNMFKHHQFELVSEDDYVNEDAKFIFDVFVDEFDEFIKFLINELTNASF